MTRRMMETGTMVMTWANCTKQKLDIKKLLESVSLVTAKEFGRQLHP